MGSYSPSTGRTVLVTAKSGSWLSNELLDYLLNLVAKSIGTCVHLTRCLRTLRARLQSSAKPRGCKAARGHSVAARGAREGPWSGQVHVDSENCYLY